MDFPEPVLERAREFEARLQAMSALERVDFLNELMAWVQIKILELYPDGG